MRRCGWVLLLIGALFLAGCGESEMEIWLNIDGSGRASVKRTINSFMSGESPSLLGNTQWQGQQLTNQIASLIKKSSGIEAWQNIRIERTEEKSLIFYGTAYFSDIGQIHIAPFHSLLSQGFLFDWQQPDIEEPGRFEIRHRPAPDTPDWSTLPEAEWRAIPIAQIKAWRDKQRVGLALTPAIMALSPAQVTIHLPGTITAPRNLEQINANSVKLVMDPLDLVESWIGVVKDDTMLARALSVEADKKDPGHAIRYTLGMAFAALGPYTAEIKTVRESWFDYPTVMEAARAGEAAMWEKLGREDAFALPVTRPPTGVQVRGAIWRPELVADKAGRWQWDEPSCRVYVQAELEEAAAGTIKARIHKARCPAGQTLLAQSTVKLAYNQVSRSRDKRAVLLSIDLAAPSTAAAMVAELEGVIEYQSSRARREIDLGFKDLAAGASGTRFDARVARISRGLWGQTSGETLQLAIDRRAGLQVQGISVVTPDGEKRPCDTESWYRSGEFGFEIMLREGGTIPRNATLVLDVLDPPRNIEIPFAFTNIPIQAGKPGDFD